MKDKLKVAAYCRVSTDKDDQANSLASQIEYFTEYISNNKDWTQVDIYHDDGISGTSRKNRTNFNRMMNDAGVGKIDLIVTKEVSRFARNTVDTLQCTRELKSNGVGVLFINDNINTLDTEGEFRLTIMASVAQEESRKTSERVKWGHKRRMEQGIVFGRDMLGYFVRGGKLIINHEEAEIVKLIYHKYLNEDKGTHVIARELYEAGIKAKRVKQWSNTVILRVLRNEKYVGDLLQKKTFTPDYLSHSKKYNRGNEDKVYLKDHHEPIIDRVMWDNVQKELAKRSPSEEQKAKHSNRYWCSGKLVCGECGVRFVSRTKKIESGKYKAWRCYNSATHGTKKVDEQGNTVGCDNGSINEKILLYCISFVIDFIMGNKDKITNDLIQDIKSIRVSTTTIDTSKLKKQVDEINMKKKRIINLLVDELISKDDFKLMNTTYDEEMENIIHQIEQAENINSISEQQAENLNLYIAEIEKMLSFDSSTDKELMYREILDKIIIYSGKILDIYLKCLPSAIRVRYSTFGRLESYKITVEDMYNGAPAG